FSFADDTLVPRHAHRLAGGVMPGDDFFRVHGVTGGALPAGGSRTGFQPVSPGILPAEDTGAGSPGDRLEACPAIWRFMERRARVRGRAGAGRATCGPDGTGNRPRCARISR